MKYLSVVFSWHTIYTGHLFDMPSSVVLVNYFFFYIAYAILLLTPAHHGQYTGIIRQKIQMAI